MTGAEALAELQRFVAILDDAQMATAAAQLDDLAVRIAKEGVEP